MIIADASIVIALAKISKLELLKLLYEEVAIGPKVKVEVIDKGKAINAREVKKIEKGLEEAWIREIRLTTKEKGLAGRILKDTRLDRGEAESLALASRRRLMIVIDDKEARAMAEAMDVEYLGTAGVLLEAFVKGHMSYEELEEAVRDLGKVVWLSPDVVVEVLKTAREVRE